jgi:hypothetical protein
MHSRETSSRFVVSYWVIPEGYRYDIAYVNNAFFDTKEEADRFAKSVGLEPPALAMVCTTDELDAAIKLRPDSSN